MFVVEEHRNKGISKRLVKAILKDSRDSHIFATSRVDNDPMHEVLVRNGFTKAGSAFVSYRGNQLKLFLYYSPIPKARTLGLHSRNVESS